MSSLRQGDEMAKCVEGTETFLMRLEHKMHLVVGEDEARSRLGSPGRDGGTAHHGEWCTCLLLLGEPWEMRGSSVYCPLPGAEGVGYGVWRRERGFQFSWLKGGESSMTREFGRGSQGLGRDNKFHSGYAESWACKTFRRALCNAILCWRSGGRCYQLSDSSTQILVFLP